jgi:ABC-2 type transport system permease protein
MATALAVAVFGVAFVLRMMADSGPGTHWLLWTTPFGWSELMSPFSANDSWPLLPTAFATVGLAAGAIALAARRDAGDGVLASQDVTPVRPFGLRTQFGLSARLELPGLSGWCVGALAAGLSFGIIAKMTTASIPPSMADTLDKFGVRGSFVDQYFGVVFLLVATIVALLPAGQVGAACDEETSGRSVHLMARPVRRSAWLGGRLALGAVGIVAAAVLAGLGAWLGARTQGLDVGLVRMLGAGANVIPTALVALGIGAVVLAVAPRAAAGAVYGVVIWSLLVDLLGSMVAGLAWTEHLSLFHYMALAPAQAAEARTLAVTAAVGAALCVLATVLFDRRDLRPG